MAVEDRTSEKKRSLTLYLERNFDRKKRALAKLLGDDRRVHVHGIIVIADHEKEDVENARRPEGEEGSEAADVKAEPQAPLPVADRREGYDGVDHDDAPDDGCAGHEEARPDRCKARGSLPADQEQGRRLSRPGISPGDSASAAGAVPGVESSNSSRPRRPLVGA